MQSDDSLFASTAGADWLRQFLRVRLDKASRLAKGASVERIRQLNRGASVVLSSCLSYVEKAKEKGERLNTQNLVILAENIAFKADGTDFGKGKKSAARKLRKVILWCLATLQPAQEQVTA